MNLFGITSSQASELAAFLRKRGFTIRNAPSSMLDEYIIKDIKPESWKRPRRKRDK